MTVQTEHEAFMEALSNATIDSVRIRTVPFLTAIHIDDYGAIGVVWAATDLGGGWFGSTLGRTSRCVDRRTAIQFVLDTNKELLV